MPHQSDEVVDFDQRHSADVIYGTDAYHCTIASTQHILSSFSNLCEQVLIAALIEDVDAALVRCKAHDGSMRSLESCMIPMHHHCTITCKEYVHAFLSDFGEYVLVAVLTLGC